MATGVLKSGIADDPLGNCPDAWKAELGKVPAPSWPAWQGHADLLEGQGGSLLPHTCSEVFTLRDGTSGQLACLAALAEPPGRTWLT